MAEPDGPVFILASGSPRRRELLAELGLAFDVEPVPGDVEAAWPVEGLEPREFVLTNARAKAVVARERWPDRWILAADTVVVLDDDVLGKPGDIDEAAAFLRRLAGREHEVATAVVILRPDGLGGECVESSAVVFHPLDDAVIDGYLADVHVLDKAGAYAVQEHGDRLVAEVRGSVSNVIGLPLEAVADLLRSVVAAAP